VAGGLQNLNHSLAYLDLGALFQGLVREFIANTLLGIEYLWGKPVQLETSEIVRAEPAPSSTALPGMQMSLSEERKQQEMKWQRVIYTMQDRKLTREVL
jgi:stage V sporulation protein R